MAQATDGGCAMPRRNENTAPMVKQLSNLFKLRIGVMMALTAVVALIVTPGQPVQTWEAAVLALTVLLAAGSAGAFNQYYERDLDQRMARTRNRPFVTGEFTHDGRWLMVISGDRKSVV